MQGSAEGVSSSPQLGSIQFKCILLVRTPSCSVKQGDNFFLLPEVVVVEGGRGGGCCKDPLYRWLNTESTPEVNSFTCFFFSPTFSFLADCRCNRKRGEQIKWKKNWQ